MALQRGTRSGNLGVLQRKPPLHARGCHANKTAIVGTTYRLSVLVPEIPLRG